MNEILIVPLGLDTTQKKLLENGKNYSGNQGILSVRKSGNHGEGVKKNASTDFIISDWSVLVHDRDYHEVKSL